MNFRLSNDNSCPCGIFDSKFCLALLTANATNATRQVIAMKCLDILDLKSFQVEVVETKHSHAILQFEAKHETLQKVSTLLDSSNVLRRRASSQLDHFSFGVHSDLQLHMLNESLEHAIPVLPEWRETMPGHGNFPIFTGFSGQIAHLDFIEFYLVCVILASLLDSLELGELLHMRVVYLHCILSWRLDSFFAFFCCLLHSHKRDSVN